MKPLVPEKNCVGKAPIHVANLHCQFRIISGWGWGGSHDT